MKRNSISGAAAALVISTGIASAQNVDSGTITGVHQGVDNLCASVTLSSGKSYAVSFQSDPTPGFTTSQIDTLGSNIGKMAQVTFMTQTTSCGVADPNLFGQLFNLPTLKGSSVHN